MERTEESLSGRILVVDDDVRAARVIQDFLGSKGYCVEHAVSAIEAVRILEKGFDLVITDVTLPGLLNGFDLMMLIRERQYRVPVIVTSACGAVDLAIEALRLGARDYLIKPFGFDALDVAVNSVLSDGNPRQLSGNPASQHLPEFEDADAESGPFFLHKYASRIVSASDHLAKVKEMIKYAAGTNAPVFLEGESGVGKDLVARTIHALSPRSLGPFVEINCAAVPCELVESEFFGYEKGAFTGAMAAKEGKLEVGRGGTVYLNEIGEMSANVQAKLLQFCQNMTFYRLGGKTELNADVRLIAATNAPMQWRLKQSLFRKDLYFRLNVVNIRISPLRERPEDIPLLAEHFLEKYKAIYPKAHVSLSDRLLYAMGAYGWPGNARELENLMHRMVIFDDEEPVLEYIEQELGDHDQHSDRAFQMSDLPLRERSKAAAMREEKCLIIEALRRTKGNKKQAAELLGISYRALIYKTKWLVM